VFLPPNGKSSTKTSLKDACNNPIFLYPTAILEAEKFPQYQILEHLFFNTPLKTGTLSSMVNQAEWHGNDPN